MKSLFTRIIVAGALSAGLAAAQGRGFGGMRHGPAMDPQQRIAARIAHMSAVLNLTDAQRQQATTIFNASYQSSQAMQPSLAQARALLIAGAEANSPDIDKLSANVGSVMSQVVAIHAKAFAQFYAILTPGQQGQLMQLQSTGGGPFGLGMGMMGRGGFGAFCQNP